jgi:UDP-N-acetylmuramate dehydrogenase
VKVSAAWLIEQAGFRKGYPATQETRRTGRPGARISAKHTLALVNPGGATADSLLGLAREIRDGVRDVFGVELANEPVVVGRTL